MKLNLKPNIDGVDREIRLIGGFLLTAAGCISKNNLVKSIGCMVMLTGITRKCFLYDLLGINTNKNS